MSLSIPVDFTTFTGKSKNADGYPTQIKAADLQKNFVYCALDTVDGMTSNETGPGGFSSRRLKILPGSMKGQILYWDGTQYTPLSPPPQDGTHVLGAVYGELQWIATEEC